MQKTIVKTETVAEFLARGGKITKIPGKIGAKMPRYPNPVKEVEKEEIDFNALPTALKIKYGIRSHA